MLIRKEHFHGLLEVLVAVQRATGWQAKWTVLTGRPDTVDPAIRNELESQFLSADAAERSPAHNKSRRFRGYVVAQLAGILFLLFTFLLIQYHIPAYLQLLTALFILLTAINCGALLEQRRWVLYLEIGRVAVLWLALYTVLGYPMFIVLAYIGGLSIWAYFSLVQKRYFQLVYGA